MILKEELEILRGEPIQVFDGDPMDIPCIETSDPEKLCKNPVVSVIMVTYNHEPYIRQAIEGVMMQKTDFEFELIIGEDCSQDKTREICFEYQKKYPDKIRVLWWHENVSRFGGNARRVTARCRGKFIAFCEGDDYWTSPDKLQRQVEVFRGDQNIGMVATSGIIVDSSCKPLSSFQCQSYGLVECEQMKNMILNSFWFGVWTCAIMCRLDLLRSNSKSMSILSRMRLRCGDVQMELAISDKNATYFMPEKMVAYRRNATSVTGNPRSNFMVGRDGILVRYAYAKIKGLIDEQDSIMKWYVNYMSESGFQFLPFLTWLRYFRKSDKKVVVLKKILIGSLKRVIKRIVHRLRNKAENI